MTAQLHRLIDSGASQAVINERIAALIENCQRADEANASDLKELAKRVSALEMAWWKQMGIFGVITTVIGAVFTFIAKFWKP